MATWPQFPSPMSFPLWDDRGVAMASAFCAALLLRGRKLQSCVVGAL